MNQRIFGTILVALGTLFLLDTWDVIDAGTVLRTWWPLVLVGIGVAQFRSNSPLGGAIVIAIGGAFLLRNLELIPQGLLSALWPLILIVIGAALIFGRRSGLETTHGESSVRLFTAFSSSDHRLESQEWRRTELTVMFGSTDIDARATQPAADGAVLDVSILAGEITLRVPEGWQVVPEALVLLGEIEDKRPRTSGHPAGAPRVTIRGFIMMGSIEVTS